MYICEKEILADFNLAVVELDRQTAKFNSPPNFLAIRYSYPNILYCKSGNILVHCSRYQLQKLDLQEI